MATFSTFNENGWLGGYSADMGEYTGPWPLMPPGVMLGCTGPFSEVDFYIGLPNPADPTTISAQFDGTYPTPAWWAFRVVDLSDPSGFTVTWGTGQRGGGTVPDGSTPPPAGMHLFLVVWPDSGPPPAAPEDYVPPGYTATGTAAFKTGGGWSPWQTGLPGSNVAGRASDGTNWRVTGSGSSAGAGDVESASLTTLAQTAIDTILTAGTAGAGTAAGSLSVSAGKSDPDIGSPFGEAGVTVVADFVTAHYPATPHNFDPITDLVFDVDYGPAPFGALSYEYESTDPADFTWADLAGAASLEISTDSGAATGLDLATTFRLEILSAVVPVGSVGLTAGTVLTDVAVDSTSGTAPWSEALPFGTGPDLVLSAAPAALYDGADTSTFPDFTGAGNLAWSADVSLPSSLAYSWTTSRWRYWLPNPIIPAGPVLKTIGENFRSIGGAQIKSLIGGVWVPVQRHG